MKSNQSGQPTILIADDDPTIRRLASRILAQHGYRIIEACDGADALRIASEHGGPIGLLLTDIIMPQLNGLELAERLSLERPELKVLFMSGHLEGMLAASANPEMCLLKKPFSVEGLVVKVRELLASPL